MNIYFHRDNRVSSVFCLKLLHVSNLDVTTSSLYREVPMVISSHIPPWAFSINSSYLPGTAIRENVSPVSRIGRRKMSLCLHYQGKKKIVPPHRHFIASKQAWNKIHPYLLKYYLFPVNQISCFIRNKNSLFYLKLELVCDCYSTGSDVITHLWAVSRSVHFITIVAGAKPYTSSSLRWY